MPHKHQEEVVRNFTGNCQDVRTETKTYCCEVTAYTFWTVLFRWMMCICFSIHSDIIIFLNMIYYYLHKTDLIEM